MSKTKTIVWDSKLYFLHVIKFFTDLIFLDKYGHTIMVTIIVTMEIDNHGSCLGSLSQVRLVQDT